MPQAGPRVTQTPKNSCQCLVAPATTREVSLADKIAIGNDAIVGFSAVIALGAAIVAARALKWQIALAAHALQSEYYRTVVVQPALELVHKAEADSMVLLDQFSKRLEQCTEVDQGRTILSEMVESYRTAIAGPHRRILRSVSALGDESLKGRVAACLFAIEDLNTEFPKLVTDPSLLAHISDALRDATDDLLSAIVQYDLVAPDNRIPARKPLPALRARIVRFLSD